MPIDYRLGLLRALRVDPDSSQQIDRSMLEHILGQQQGLRLARENLGKMQELVEKLSAEPWFSATFLGWAGANGQTRVLVRQGGTERVVGLGEGIDPDTLATGDRVYLSRELNFIIARAPDSGLQTGATCSFERKTTANRLVVKYRDQEYLVAAPPSLLDAPLQPGDELRWDPEALLATEKIERAQTSAFFVEDVPAEQFDNIGGLDAQIAEIRNTLLLHWKQPNAVELFKLPRKGSVLLVGPAGNGKTLLAKALANWLAGELGATHPVFMNIKPSALHSMWYSQSESNYREIFRVARQAAARHPAVPVVMFFDEVDSIGAMRGQSLMRVHDNVLTAFIAELEGLANRGNVLVVAATNRREALDPALLRPGRLGDLILEVPRPDQKAARQILCKHLPEDMPYARNGHGDDATRARTDIIDAAVSHVYAPNGMGDLATILFRDAKRRPVRPADLVSGATLANAAQTARERACRRYIQTHQLGLTCDDVLVALQREFETAARTLTPANCRSYLSDLPQDTDPVSVELTVRRVANPQRFLNVI